ncbi:MAG TPA: N-acetyltransferase DgcN [Alphaproteobacteria bacterium]|nr:N-acetyltransferase DgcN [Alphaproteobacteria bacterium]
MEITRPYLLFLGDAHDDLAAKTASGIKDWRPEWCVGQLRLEGCKTSLGLPDLSLEEAARKGAKTLIIGVANRGGVIGPKWAASLLRAVELGLDIASGLHSRLESVPGLAAAATKGGRKLHDVRHPTQEFPLGSGEKRPGKRLLTVGTDASIGKMYTTLSLERELRKRGLEADFRATGQTGIFIAGSGVSIDAVVSDFVSGAVEWLTPANDPEHWDLIEGQGSLLHPSFAGVTLGLIHGAQPDALVLCHEPTRTHMRGLPRQPMPSVEETMALCLAAARLTNKAARFVGVSINSSKLAPQEATKFLAECEGKFGLPAVDPLRTGVGRIADQLLKG